MANVDTSTECKTLRVWDGDSQYIDHWVVSHNILPFVATVYGWDFRWVIIAVYLAETVENLVWCLEGRFKEDPANSLISDPIMGMAGVLVGYAFRYTYGVIRDQNDYIRNAREAFVTLFDVALLVAPSGVLYSSNDRLYWLYLVLFPISFSIVSRHDRNWKRLVTAFIYVLTMCLVILGHPNDINSFYSGLMVSIIATVVFFLLYQFRSKSYEII